MKREIITNSLKRHLKALNKASEVSTRSGEELKSITEAIEKTVVLLDRFSIVPSDSDGNHYSNEKSITNPLIEN